jgi:hypothetical protein
MKTPRTDATEGSDGTLDVCAPLCELWQNEHLRLLAENAELRKDKSRLDWLDRNALLRQRTLAIMERDGDVLRWAGVEWSGEPDDTLRAVIDAAMKETKNPNTPTQMEDSTKTYASKSIRTN